MTDVLYQVDEVTKTYGGRQVLHVQRLQIRQGEILALVGPSGAGKSTLLRLLNFLETPDRGRIVFLEHSFSASRAMPLEKRRQVTTVFQKPLLLRRTVRANVGYGLRLRGERDGDEQIERALAQVGLEEMARQPARTLSGGEAQRVALARALVFRPDVLLLDEPTANLDPYNVSLIEQIVRDLNEREGTTVVLVTHNVFQARRLADRVALILDGEVVEVAGVDSFFEAPVDVRTAAFVNGEMVY